MAKKEIEKKYLIREDGIEYITDILLDQYASVEELKKDVLNRGNHIHQGFLPLGFGPALIKKLGLEIDFEPSVVRLRKENDKYYSLTLKSEGLLSRDEEICEIKESLFDICWPYTHGRRVEKMNLNITYLQYNIEVDVHLDRDDLIISEIEVSSVEEAEKLPPLGKDVTYDKKYKNVNLAK